MQGTNVYVTPREVNILFQYAALLAKITTYSASVIYILDFLSVCALIRSCIYLSHFHRITASLRYCSIKRIRPVLFDFVFLFLFSPPF